MGSGEPTNVIHSSRTHKSTSFASNNADELWDRHSYPEFCNECFELFKDKNWAELGKRHEYSLEKLLQTGRRASDNS